ncbi:MULTISPECIES: hypothetical protein [Peptoniphilus]|uniref:hypothetical protein n=1 Tax=Peptoniphilus TaxID=162289 RepID=UPI0001DA9A01|nr:MULTISPECIES: hypothetical protein [Peptoniphilus]EFI41819.1 hypothetical protein HMPREF0629_00447 [Peptoniphilus sp. oral taxon 386 str. F0131]
MEEKSKKNLTKWFKDKVKNVYDNESKNHEYNGISCCHFGAIDYFTDDDKKIKTEK